mmetsp:Transcript_9469/g.15195  ORF Transcript_9469/g.15195 Transcript_9469/m.15195 type:complete len:478 (-) Transcript_9469:137-1570(-)|eukprot:jgi/Bigna1/72795/fgenesh1_pg.21_\
MTPLAWLLAMLACGGGARHSRALPSSSPKRVLNTPWWPAGTERTLESVGILSRGLIFASTMMETNQTLPRQIRAELQDVGDICNAANTSITNNHHTLVDCLVNVADEDDFEKKEGLIRHEFAREFGAENVPALTIVKISGEFTGLPTSTTCTAITDKASASVKRVERGQIVAVTATPVQTEKGGKGEGAGSDDNNNDRYRYAWISMRDTATDEKALSQVGDEIDSMLKNDFNGNGAVDLVDCIAFLKGRSHGTRENGRNNGDHEDSLASIEAKKIRKWFEELSSGKHKIKASGKKEKSSGVLTIVKEEESRNHSLTSTAHSSSPPSFKLRCTAVLGSSKTSSHDFSSQLPSSSFSSSSSTSSSSLPSSFPPSSVKTVVAGGFVYLSGAFSHTANATDALANIATALEATNESSLNLTVNCLYFGSQQLVMKYFEGFRYAFNENAPPPPTRGEFGATPAECSGKDSCVSVIKCVAARK